MLLVFGVYVLTMSGHTYSPDEETMLAASQSLIVDGSWALPSSRALVEVTGADGRRYSQYGPGQSVAAVPWVIVGRTVGSLFPKDQAGFPLRLILASYNALIAAGICGLLAATGMALGYSALASLWTAAALAFATFMWPHSRTFFSEPLVALCILASFYLMRTGPRSRRSSLVFLLSGVLFAFAIATKVQYAVALPAFLLYLSLVTLRRPTSVSDTDNPQSVRSAFRNLQSAIPWLLGLALGLIPLFLYNLAIFGGAFTTGYGADLKGTFKTPLYEGAFGLLFSSGKGLLWYALPILLALWGLPRFARAHRAETAFIAALFVSLVAFFGMYSFWPGDGSWGPRYMIPLLPFVLLPGLDTMGQALLHARARANAFSLPAFLVSTVLALGFLVNLMGVLVNFDTYINVVNDDATRYWQLDSSPIEGHARLLGQRVEEWTSRIFPPSRTILFRSGFSYSEGDKSKGELLPRWTTGAGALDIHPTGSSPISVALQLADHRPPELPRAQVSILLDGAPVQPATSPVQGSLVSTIYSFEIPSRSSKVTIQTDSWNPSQIQEGGRNEVLGVMIERVAVEEGGKPSSYSMVEALPAPAYYPQPRWYYDPGTHHPSDLWLTYMPETGMGNKTMLALTLPFVVVSLFCLWLAWRGLRTA